MGNAMRIALVLILALGACTSGPDKADPVYGAALIWPTSGTVFQGFYGTEATSSISPSYYYDEHNKLKSFAGLSHFHRGLDIDNSEGTSVVAVASGQAKVYPWDGKSKDFGNCVVIDHGNDLYSVYGHLKEIKVAAGYVSQGQIIGLMGTTGNSTGPHLHLSIRHQSDPSSIALEHFIPGQKGDRVVKGQPIPFAY